MDVRKGVGLAAGVISIGLLFLTVHVSQQPPVMSAGGEPVGTLISWTTVLSYITGGSFLTTILALWKQVQPLIKTINPALPVPPADPTKTVEDVLELVAAVANYATKKDDKNAQRRLMIAVLTECEDMTEMANPEIAAKLHDFSAAIIAKWFPTQSTGA